jgi:outer membrane protein assembly factor BamB
VPDDAAPVTPADAALLQEQGAPDFPADLRTLAFSAADFAGGGEPARRLLLSNPHHAVLHIRLSTAADWLKATPTEVALGPGEAQAVSVQVSVEKARAAVEAGAAPVAPVRLAFRRLFPGSRGVAPSPTVTDSVYVRLPLATCPACNRTLGHGVGGDADQALPDVCPFCFERLRPCPVCGAPNSWLARRCVLDPQHVVRSVPDWPVTPGGAPDHGGCRAGTTTSPRNAPTPPGSAAPGPALSRRWSFPSVPPASHDAALAWSAPVAAYGLVAAAAATAHGDGHVYAFDTTGGAPLWDPYPLPDPVYPERGGVAIAAGKLFAATVEGVLVCLDVLRGTRLWETKLDDGRVYGAVVPAGEDGPLLVPAATSAGAGCLYAVDLASGGVTGRTPLDGPPDSAPAAAAGAAFVHDDTGTITAADVAGTRGILWKVSYGIGFDAAPVVRQDRVYSATANGTVFCHEATTGAEVWRVAVTNAACAGTPAHDGTLLYVPADDGVHLVSAAGRPVRRYGLKRPVRAAPVVSDGTVLFGATDGAVYGAGASGRSLQVLYETGGAGSQVVAAPALTDGALFVPSTNGVLYALSLG